MANPRCHKADQSCLPDRVTASAPPEVVIPGPPITARVLELPEYHSGLTRVSFQIEFSEPLFTDLRDLSKRALQVGGAALDGVHRPDDRYDLLEVALAPRSGDDVTIELFRGPACADGNRICLDDLLRLSDPLKLTIPAATSTERPCAYDRPRYRPIDRAEGNREVRSGHLGKSGLFLPFRGNTLTKSIQIWTDLDECRQIWTSVARIPSRQRGITPTHPEFLRSTPSSSPSTAHSRRRSSPDR